MTEDTNSKFNWKAFFFPAAYFAGKGQVGKGILIAVLASIPGVFLFVPFWAGFKAKTLQAASFSWPKAIGVFLLHGFLLVNVLNAIDSGKKASKEVSRKAMTAEEVCQELVNEMNPSFEKFNKLSVEIDERVNLIAQKRFESESDKTFFKSAKRELAELSETIAGDNMNEYLRNNCKEKGFKLLSESK